ncbi:extracellular solute-binding protein [Candidatus Dojkabacteria bacterium]|uniref:Extracellular solute-binding protein n=1 Tax=Candidatus Dojkabacteria bacterium TaxID=2099670 RepID=A0A955L242_9BACT|nr:extracellular solute-binding protein [Candidatus Dojkabacteria bacterium]
MSDNDINNIEPYTVEELPELPAGSDTSADYSTESFDTSTSSTRKFPFFLVIIALVVIGLIALGFLLLNSIGSGGDNNTNTDNTGTNTNTNTGNNNGGTTTNAILIWRGVFLDPDVIQPLIDEYHDANPNITIQYSNEWPLQQPFDQAMESYQLQLNQDLEDTIEAADIFMVHNSWTGDYENIAAPSTIYNADSFGNTFYPAAVTDLVSNGVVYGVPLWMDTFAVVYNKDMLASVQKSEPDISWDDFQNTARELTTFSGTSIEQSGFAFGNGSNIGFPLEIMQILMRQNGVVLTDENDYPAFAQDSNSVDAFNFFLGFANGQNRTWDADFSDASAAFLEEKTAMIIVPSWRLRQILAYNDDAGLGLDIGVAQLPQFSSQDKEIINWTDYWPVMVNKERGNSAAAWNFLSWLTEPDQLEQLNTNIENSSGYFGNLYPRSDMSEKLFDDEYLNVYNRSLPFAESWKMVKGRKVRELFVDALSKSSVSASQIATLEEQIKTLIDLKGVRETLETQTL